TAITLVFGRVRTTFAWKSALGAVGLASKLSTWIEPVIEEEKSKSICHNGPGAGSNIGIDTVDCQLVCCRATDPVKQICCVGDWMGNAGLAIARAAASREDL